MTSLKYQSINFIEVLPFRYDRIPSFWHIIASWFILAALVYAGHVGMQFSHNKLISKSNSLKESLDRSISFLNKGQSSDDKVQIVAVADNDLDLNNKGYMGPLVTLSKHTPRTVWFNSFVFNQKSNSMVFNGNTSSTLSLNNFFNKIKVLDTFKNSDLVLRNIAKRSSKDGESSTHSFVISGKIG
jgi:hypothetical protein